MLRTLTASLNGGELAPRLHRRSDIAKYQTGLKECANFILRVHGGARRRDGFVEIGGFKADTGFIWPISFEITDEETYSLEFSDNYLRFVYRGAYILKDAEHPCTAVAGSAVFTRAAHGFTTGDRVFVEASDPALADDFFEVEALSVNTLSLRRQSGTLAVSTTGAGITLREEYGISTPYTCMCATRLHTAQDQNTLYLFSPDHAPYKLRRVAPNNWVLEAETFAPSIAAPTTPTVVATTPEPPADTTYAYKVSAVDAVTGEESLPSPAGSVSNNLALEGNVNTISWTAVSGASRYLIYKEDNGVFGYIGGTEGLSFVDRNVVADLSDTPQQLRNPFVGAGNYPRTGTFFEQRMWFAATKNDPAAVWASQSGNTRNLNVSSPTKDSDAITFRVRAAKAANVQALVALRSLMLMTTKMEWRVDASLQEGFLTPNNIVLRPDSYWGSCAVAPILVGETMLFAPRGDRSVRDWSPDRQPPTRELSLFAEHLFEGHTVVAWAYQQVPDSVVWVVTDTGRLYTLTYHVEHDIWGWARQPIDGLVRGVACVQEGAYDAVYISLERGSGSARRLSLGRLAAPADEVHTDHSLAYVGAPTQDVYGLSHLAGTEVDGVIDGRVVKGLLVDDHGHVALPYPGSKVSLGVPYVGRLRTLDLDIGPQPGLGSTVERPKTLSEVRISVLNSGLLWVAHGTTDPVEVKRQAPLLWGDEAELFTGTIKVAPEADWTGEGDIVIEARDPRPVEVLAVLADWEFTE